MSRIRERSILAVVEEAVAPATVADEEKGGQKDQGADGAGLSLQQETQQVEAHEHGVVEPQRRVQRLGDEQHGEKPLQTIHSGEERWSDTDAQEDQSRSVSRRYGRLELEVGKNASNGDGGRKNPEVSVARSYLGGTRQNLEKVLKSTS